MPEKLKYASQASAEVSLIANSKMMVKKPENRRKNMGENNSESQCKKPAIEQLISEAGPGGPGGRSTRGLSIRSLISLEGLSAIDLGSNLGYNSFDLYECGCSRVLGVEARDNYLEEAEAERKRLQYQNVEFMKADIRLIDEMNLGKFDLCLCSGLLYHMQNPFNLLKRIRNICRILALETHICPPFYRFFQAAKKYRNNLCYLKDKTILDGVPFTGRRNVFPDAQNMLLTSGSIDVRETFWFDESSLIRAVDLAGFKMHAFYYQNTPEGFPKILIHHGYERTKVFLLVFRK
jgi:SAM-dependent methyltransferase